MRGNRKPRVPAPVSTPALTASTPGFSAGRCAIAGSWRASPCWSWRPPCRSTRLVRQEYLPSNVDEGEFDVRVTTAEGTGLGAMNEVALKIEAELKATSRRAVRAGVGRQRILWRAQQRQLLRRASRRTRSAPSVGRDCFSGRPGGRSRAITASATSNRKSASACRKFPDLRVAGAQSADLRRRRPELRH